MASRIAPTVDLFGLGHPVDLFNLRNQNLILVQFFPKDGDSFMRVVNLTGNGGVLSDKETDDIIENLKKLPKIDPRGLTRTFANGGTHHFRRLVWDSNSDEQRVFKCYAGSFVIYQDILKVCIQPVDIRDIDNHYQLKLLCFKYDGYSYKIICNGTRPLTLEKTEQLFKETVARLQTGHKSQEDPDGMTRTYANIPDSTYEDIARRVLTDPMKYYCRGEYITDSTETNTIRLV